MIKAKNLLTGMLAVLAVLLLTGCWEKDNPSRTSLDVDTSTLTMSVGETAVRMATSKAEDAAITYTSSNPAVATVDQFGKVTALTEGETTITIDMAETKKSWYAAKTLTYSVVVKNVSAQALANVDKATPLTLVAQADGKITVTFNNGITLANDIKYTINNGAEQTIAKNTTGSFDIEVKKGDVVQLYSINTSLGGGAVAGARGTTRAVDSGAKYINIRPSMKTEIYGNVMSLLKGKDNLESATALEAKNAFYGLFAGAEKLVNNAERQLVLPATTLTEGCYQDMFNGCKGIEKAPELPAPKLEKNCYQEMFYDCAKLNHVKCLATDITAENSTKDWLGKAGTEATETKVLESVVDMTKNSDDGVPTSWMAQKIVAVTGIELDADEMKLSVGGVGTLKATVEPTDATEKTITWTSDKPSIATVDANGNVTGVAAGTATITAQAGEKTATCVVTVTDAPIAIDLSKLTDAYEAQNGDVLTGTLKESVMISIADGATVTLDGVSINADGKWNSCKYAGITCSGDANIILKDGSTNTVKGLSPYDPGIYVPDYKTLTIKGTGSLEASSNGKGAGIGGGREIACGNIEIQGGTVSATGGEEAAGIGSGYNAGCGAITITSGVTSVTATKGAGAPNSIGKGAGWDASCGTVTIGGTVYWDGEAKEYKNGGDTYLTQSKSVYPTPSVALSAVTSTSYLGWRICSDGKAYAAAGPLPSGVTAVAMIAYVGNGSNCTHGLAIQLNANPASMDWSAACSYSSYPSITGNPGTWRLPSKTDWQNMFVGCAKSGDASASDNMNPIAGFKEKIGATGITWKSFFYWSSLGSGSFACYVLVSLNGSNAKAVFNNVYASNEYPVLGCLAF